MSNKRLQYLITFLQLVLMATLLFSALSGCKPREITIKEKVFVQDSSAVASLQKRVDSFAQLSDRYREEITTLTIENAVLQSGIGKIDSALPAQEYRKWSSGDSYFELWHQGEINRWNFYLGARQSSSRELFDSSSFWQSRFKLANDSILKLSQRLEQKELDTHTVEKPGFFDRLWILLKNAWWLLIVGAVGYMILRRYLPFLP